MKPEINTLASVTELKEGGGEGEGERGGKEKRRRGKGTKGSGWGREMQIEVIEMEEVVELEILCR